MERISCLMCGKRKHSQMHTVDTLYGPKMNGLTIVKCDNCGFMFMNPMPTQKEMASFYPESLHSGKRKSRLKFLKRYYEKIRLKMVMQEAKKDAKNILDIGCSNGFFLEMAKKKGLEAYGTEISQKQVNYLRKHVTKNAYTSEKELLGKVKFDIITAFDVIEHLRDPEGLIKNCSQMLNKDGIMVIMTMVTDSWTYRLFKGKVTWISFQHLVYFSRAHLRKLLGKYGLEIYREKAYNNSLLHALQFARYAITRRKFSFSDEIIFFIRRKKTKKYSRR